jgi:hypothetical protein
MDDAPGFNDAGQIAFRSSLSSDVPGEVTPSNNYGVWAGAPGNVQLIARSGSPSPLAGVNFATPEPNPRINDSGQVVFVTNVTGSGVTLANNKIVWLTTPSGTEVLARRGTQAPGTPAGVNFNQLEAVPAAINDAGQVAFTATLVIGGSVTTSNDRGLWAGEPGNLSLVAREGDVIDVDPGPGEILKTIASFSFANGYIFNTPSESASAAFNDAGQIAWQAQFTDATRAIFLTTLPDDSLDGDYNDDGTVDAADYVVWRKTDGTQAGYDAWTANFGQTAGRGSAASRAVPEPASALLALVPVVGLLKRRSGHGPRSVFATPSAATQADNRCRGDAVF